MTAKEYLNQVLILDSRLTLRLRNHEKMKELVNRTTSVLSDMPRNPGRDPFRREKGLVELIDDAREINDLTDQYIDLRREVADNIGRIQCSKLSVKDVLEGRYLKRKSWEELAADLCMTVRHVQRLHGEGLAALEEVLMKDVAECPKMSENVANCHGKIS